MKGLQLTESQKDEIRELRRTGLTGNVIARRFSIDVSYVYRVERQVPNEAKRKRELAGETAHLTLRKRPLERRLTLEDRDALVLQYESFVNRIARSVYWKVRRTIELDDLIQEARLSLIGHADRHDPAGLPFRLYVKKGIGRELWDFVNAGQLVPKARSTRKKGQHGFKVVSLDAPRFNDSTVTLLHELRSAEPDPCSSAVYSDLKAKVESAYQTLTPRQQSAMHLVFDEDLSFSAAAISAGVPRKKIRDELLAGVTDCRNALGVTAVGLINVTCRSHRSVREVTADEWQRIEVLMSTDTPRDWIASKFGINRVALFTGFKVWKKAQAVLITYRTEPAALQCA